MTVTACTACLPREQCLNLYDFISQCILEAFCCCLGCGSLMSGCFGRSSKVLVTLWFTSVSVARFTWSYLPSIPNSCFVILLWSDRQTVIIADTRRSAVGFACCTCLLMTWIGLFAIGQSRLLWQSLLVMLLLADWITWHVHDHTLQGKANCYETVSLQTGIWQT